MKKLMLMIASLFLATSVASANPTSKMDFVSMNKADSQFLFNGSAKAITLSSQEMKQTEGEFWPIFWGLVYYTVTYANAPSYNDGIYSGYPNARGRWRWLNW